MTLKIVRFDDVTPQPWKNGGGVTRDLLAWPGPADWQLRVSVAEVARSGPFSAYPGIERWFAVVQGAGLVLHFADGDSKLTSDSPPLCFDGASAPGCDLVAGPTLDLNLMAHSAVGSAAMARAWPGQQWSDAAPLRGLFSARPAELIIDGRLAATLPAMSLAYTAVARGGVWSLGDDGQTAAAWWLSFTPNA